jgi:phospho-N-acetylmuramoyl-pentapeptide-transferase
VGRHARGGPERHAPPARHRRLDRPRAALPAAHLPRRRRHDERVNLTDGLDGLAGGCAAIVLLAYIGITFITSGQRDLALLSGCLVGACVGFLWFNAFPATIFMGDTGALGLGGAIAGLAVMTKTEELLVVLGGIFVVEALSVLVQVFSFQAFRKRVLLMAPVHHHFEILGWSETKIILRFWIVAAVCAAIGFTVYQQSVT